MSLLDNIVGIILVSIIVTISFVYVAAITNLNYIRSSNHIIYGIHSDFERIMSESIKSETLDKSHQNYQSESKNLFLDSFTPTRLELESTDEENGTYSCFNITKNNDTVTLESKIDTSVDIVFDSPNGLQYTDENAESGGSRFLNIACFYNTYTYLSDTRTINSTISPINYVLYTFYTDLRFNNRIVEKKGTIYFN